MSKDIIYFNLNNWFSGRDYPANGKLAELVENGKFSDNEWCKENRLCVLAGCIDMSRNWNVTAPREWVEKNCPELLTDKTYDYAIMMHSSGGNKKLHYTKAYKDFIVCQDGGEDPPIGRFHWPFLEYSEDNIGVQYWDDD